MTDRTMPNRPDALAVRTCHHRLRSTGAAVVAAWGALLASQHGVAWAQQAVTLNGPPIQVRPYVPEPGAPLIQIPLGTPTVLPPAAGGNGNANDGTDGGDAGWAGTASGPTDVLSTMIVQPWGSSAIVSAQSLGVNPAALAATCVLESGCQNLTGGTYTGAFQMGTDAYGEGLQTALAANPVLQSQIVAGDAGRTDPGTEAISAAGYLMQATQTLQNGGISDPTILDTRGYFNFGPKYSVGIASAPDSAPMSQVLAGAPSNVFTGNAIAQGETVGQWRASVIAKIGNAAGQSVLM